MPKQFAESTSPETSDEEMLDEHHDSEPISETITSASHVLEHTPLLKKAATAPKLASRAEKGTIKVDIDQVHKDIVTELFATLEFVKTTSADDNENNLYYKAAIKRVDELVNKTGFDGYKLNEGAKRIVMDFLATRSREKDLKVLKTKAQAMLDLVTAIETDAEEHAPNNTMDGGGDGSSGSRRASTATLGHSNDEGRHGRNGTTPIGTRRATRGEASHKRKIQDEELWKASFECHKAAKLLRDNQGKYVD